MNARALVIAAVALTLTGCTGGPSGDDAPTSPAATATAPASPLATPTQIIPPASDIAFPEGSSYWRNSARIPVIVYRAADSLCWYYWTGLEAQQQFTGSLTPTDGPLLWNGILGTLAYPGETPTATPLSAEFSLLGDRGNWKVTRTNPPTGGTGSFMLNDAWAPITAEEAAEDFTLLTGLSGYDAPVLTSCPSPAEFGG